VLIQQREEWNDFTHALAAEDTQIPRAQIAGVGYGRSGLAAYYLASLAGPPKIRAVNGIHFVILPDEVRSLSRFGEPFLIERNVEPAAQALVFSG
jgi:hypothetical protein